jgi:hypothetical protein
MRKGLVVRGRTVLGMAAALSWGCAEITPAEVDGSAPAGEDARAADDAVVCDREGVSDTAERVRVLYMVPSDQSVEPDYLANLEQAVLHVQSWMRDQLPDASHFSVPDPVVQVVETSHEAAWYSSNPVGEDPERYFQNNVLADASALAGADQGDVDDVWLIYVGAGAECGQRTFAGQHIAVMPENDLRGLAGLPRIPPCGGDSDSFGRCRWVGGMALMLSFAIGMPRDPACTDDDPETPCDSSGLTQQGYSTYPDASLTEAQIAFLSDSGFMEAAGLPDCELDCSVPVSE